MTGMKASHQVFAPADDVLMSDAGDMKVLLSMDTGRFVELNETGRAIWELTDGERSVAEMIEALQGRYAIGDAACEREIIEFLSGLSAEKLVRRVR